MRQTSAFKQFLASSSQLTFTPATQVTLCISAEEFLLSLCKTTLTQAWQSSAGRESVTTVEIEHFLSSKFMDSFGQGSLFDPAVLYIIAAHNSPAKFLEQIKRAAHSQTTNRLLVLLQGKQSAPLSKLIKSESSIQLVSCPEPAPYEIPDFIAFLCQQLKLKLDRSAIKMVGDCLGRDLNLIANELSRLALIFMDHKQPVTAQMIAPYLGLLKEELVFRLRNYILERRLGAAEALLVNLIDRGESGLAILGFLAKHCRSALTISECLKNGDNSNDIVKKSNLQKYLLPSYTKYVRNFNHQTFTYALQQCIEADRKMKTTRASEHLLLSGIIQTLC